MAICDTYPHMRPGSDFDATHLFCERHNVWTNMRGFDGVRHCLDDDARPETTEQHSDEMAGEQLALF